MMSEELVAMTNQAPADALEAAYKCCVGTLCDHLDSYDGPDASFGMWLKNHRLEAIRHAQDVAARYAVVEAERRVKLIAEAMRTLVDSDEYLIHARTECDCYAHNGARAALAEAQERT